MGNWINLLSGISMLLGIVGIVLFIRAAVSSFSRKCKASKKLFRWMIFAADLTVVVWCVVIEVWHTNWPAASSMADILLVLFPTSACAILAGLFVMQTVRSKKSSATSEGKELNHIKRQLEKSTDVNEIMPALQNISSPAAMAHALHAVGARQALHWLLSHEDETQNNHKLQMMAIDRLDWEADRGIIEKMALKGRDEDIRLAAVHKIKDRTVLRTLVDEPSVTAPVKRAACNRLIHSWEGCVCTRCGEHRNEGHKWHGDVCMVCGKVTPERISAATNGSSPTRTCDNCPYAANSVDNQSSGCYGPDFHEGCMLDQHYKYERG